MHELTELVKALAWPVTVVLVLYTLKAEIRQFMARLSDSVSQAAQITVGAKGLDIRLSKTIAAVNTRVTAIQATQDQVRVAVDHRSNRSERESDSTPRGPAEIPPSLLLLASNYLELNIADYRTRLRRKNDLAREMGDFVLRNDIDRHALIVSLNEGLILAYAAAVVARPDLEDVERLLNVGAFCKRLHVRYRIVLALAVVINGGLVSKSERQKVDQTLDLMARDADQPLVELIRDTRSLLSSIASGEIHASA